MKTSQFTSPPRTFSRLIAQLASAVFVVALFLGLPASASAQSANQVATMVKRFESLTKEGKYTEAVPVGKQLLAFCEKNFGASHLNTAAVAHDVGVLCQQTGDLAEAETLYRRALGIWSKALGASHASTAQAMSNLGVLCLTKEEYTEAEELLTGALKVFEKTAGTDAASAALVGVVANNLGLIHETLGDYPQAETAYSRALSIVEEAKSDDHNLLVRCLTNLGALYRTRGQLAKAEPLLQRAVAEAEKKWPDGHPDMAHPLAAMAAFHYALGDYAAADPFQTRAIQVVETKLGPEHFEMATVIGNLGLMVLEREDYPRAIALFTKALEITEKALGPEHSRVILHLGNLGLAQRGAKDYPKASESLSRALALCSVQSGGEGAGKNSHRDDELTASVINNLGLLAMDEGRYDEAEEHYQEALALYEKAMGPGHPRSVAIRENLVLTAISRQKPDEASTRAAVWDKAARQAWGSLLEFTSEAQREAAQATDLFQTFDTLGTLGDASLLAEAVLWRKGVLLESLIEERLLANAADADVDLADKCREVDSLRGRLHQALVEGNAAGLPPAKIDEDRLRLEALQKEMARQLGTLGQARSGLAVSLAEVQKHVPGVAVLVEMVRYDHHLDKGATEARYAAVIIPPAGENTPAPVFVPLGPAASLEGLVAEFRSLASRPLDETIAETAAARDTALEAKSRELHERLVAPLEKELPEGTREVILSPDGGLHFVPFVALLDAQGQFWGEKYLLWTVSTGRDLLHLSDSTLAVPGNALLLGNPAYDSVPAQPKASAPAGSSKKKGSSSSVTTTLAQGEAQDRLAGRLRAGLGQGVEDIHFPALPGTAAEIDSLKAKFEAKGWTVEALSGEEASERALRGLQKPTAVIHLATHGFFLDEREGGGAVSSTGATSPFLGASAAGGDPMLRGALALAHAGHTVEQWRGGKVPRLEEDGILTAAEVASLPLGETRLVTLSACDTGLGEVQSGEGILGLKRGFALAGTQNLLVTLWEISDDDTVALMGGFYDRLLADESPARGLSAVQVETLHTLRTSRGLHHAINRAAPFVLVRGGRAAVE